MATALPNVSGDAFVLTSEILETGFQESASSPRKRMILPLHRCQTAPVQRMLNFFQPGTYVQPHQHPQPGAIETIQVLSGSLGFVLFTPGGKVTATHRLDSARVGLIDIEPKVWHGMVALEANTAILEIKRGPYNPNEDKTFASWAPSEDASDVSGYLTGLENLFP